MAQVPPLPGAPVYRDLLIQRVDSLIQQPGRPSVWLDEGSYAVDYIEAILSDGNANVPALTLSFHIGFVPENGEESATESLELTVNSALRRDRVATPSYDVVNGPGRLNLENLRIALSSPEAESHFSDSVLTLRASIRRIDEALAEYLDVFEPDGALSEYISAPRAEYVSVPMDDHELPPHMAIIERTEPPENPREGETYFDPQQNMVRVYRGGEWIAEAVPRIRGARERGHQPFWDTMRSGDGGDDSTVVFSNGVLESRETSWYDAYICDPSWEDFCPKGMQTGHKRLFQSATTNPFVSNLEEPGIVPPGQSFNLNRIGLVLAFSDSSLYTMAFRYLRVECYVAHKMQYSFLASEWLDGAVSEGFDPDPSLGFSWSLPVRPSFIPAQTDYYVDLHLAEPFVDRLRAAEDAIQQFQNTGEWSSSEEEEKYSDWYAEIRIFLKGVHTQELG